MIIDCHTHIFNDEQLATYRTRGGSHVDRIITIHAWDLTKEDGYALTIGELIAFAKSKPNVSVIASVDFLGPLEPQVNAIESQFQAGEIVGVKLYPGYQPFYVTDTRVDPIVSLCAKFKKPLVIHGGDVYDPKGTAQLQYSHPIHIDELAVRHPDCPIVIAHFGFPYLLETANIVAKNKNVYTDISATVVTLDRASDVRALRDQFIADLKRAFTYFPDVRGKTMFGTDYAGEHTYLNQVTPYVDVVKKVFRPAQRERVLSGLAQELFFS